MVIKSLINSCLPSGRNRSAFLGQISMQDDSMQDSHWTRPEYIQWYFQSFQTETAFQCVHN